MLAARTGDIPAAEDALADAFERALRTWPHTGVPHNPEGWLITVAKNRWLDELRRGQPDLEAPATSDDAGRVKMARDILSQDTEAVT